MRIRNTHPDRQISAAKRIWSCCTAAINDQNSKLLSLFEKLATAAVIHLHNTMRNQIEKKRNGVAMTKCESGRERNEQQTLQPDVC